MISTFPTFFVWKVPAEVLHMSGVSDSSRKKHWIKVLLEDSGSDQDLLFITKGSKPCIPSCRRQIPLMWSTSAGTFHTKKVGKVDISSPLTSHLSPSCIPHQSTCPMSHHHQITAVKRLTSLESFLFIIVITVTTMWTPPPAAPGGAMMLKLKLWIENQNQC